MGNNYDSKGFQELAKIESPKTVTKSQLIADLEKVIDYQKQKIDINNKENEHCKELIRKYKFELSELKRCENGT